MCGTSGPKISLFLSRIGDDEVGVVGLDKGNIAGEHCAQELNHQTSFQMKRDVDKRK